MNTSRPALKLAAPLALVALLTVAFVGSAAAAPHKGAMKPVKALIQSHMQLGQHYMMVKEYKKARDHFQQVIDLQVDPLDKGELFAEAPEGDDKGARRGRGRNPARKLAQVKLRAYMGAAIASWKLGDEDAAEGFAEAGLELAQSKGIRRGVKRFERFLDDPDEVIERAAPSVEKLKARIERAEEALAKP